MIASSSSLSSKSFILSQRSGRHRPPLPITCSSSRKHDNRTKNLRSLLQKPGLLLGPAVYDGISAKLTEDEGFEFAFMSGFSVAGARLAKPDTGLLSYGEILDQGRNMHEATASIPIIGDGDTGYGNAMNVKRTVQGYSAAGFAGILIEDQVWPKSCGHVRGKRVIPRDEAVARIRAACYARDEGSDIVIVARTDARQAESFQEAIYRAAAFADAGADVVFVDALETIAEMRTLCVDVQHAHKMANMLEGGGKTPILSPQELEELGFKLCAYPLSLLGVSIAAMRKALAGLKKGVVPRVPDEMLSFQDLQVAVGFPRYFEEEIKYAVKLKSNSGSIGTADGESPPGNTTGSSEDGVGGRRSGSAAMVLEPDMVIEPGSVSGASKAEENDAEKTFDIMSSRQSMDDGQESGRKQGMASQWFRVKVTNIATGAVNLDLKIPSGFLGSIAQLVPQIAGYDLDGLFKGVARERGETIDGGVKNAGDPVFSVDADGDRIDFYFE